MPSLAAILEFLSKITPILLIIGGLLGFLFREKIKQVLSRAVLEDVEKLKANLAKELAEHSAKLQRDVESYKVSLIAEAEKVKATQDVKKSIALKIAEKRFAALSSLLDVHLGLDTSIGAHLTMPQSRNEIARNHFLNNKIALIDRLGKYSAAADAAILFITPEVRNHIIAVRQSANAAFALRSASDDQQVDIHCTELQSLLTNSGILEQELRRLLNEMETFA